MNRKILILIAALVAAPMGVQAQETLEQLLRQVEQAASAEARVDQERLQRFIRERNNQRQLLEEARAELRREEQRSERLRNSFEQPMKSAWSSSKPSLTSAWVTWASCLVLSVRLPATPAATSTSPWSALSCRVAASSSVTLASDASCRR
jgi:hypothetical protein